MIAQIMAIEHPEQVRSLTSLMSTTGDGQVGQPTEAAMALLVMPPVGSREDAFDRASDPAGVARQLAAALSTPDRTEDLRRLSLPALVIHGVDDPLVAVSGGHATAEAIPGAGLVVIEGMGHDLPRPLWPTVVERISGLVARDEQQRAAVIDPSRKP